MHTKRRQNNMNGGGTGGNGQQRYQNNNRPRRFNNNRPQGSEGNDPASVARNRRNATQSKEKYQMMARDAMSSGDRVLSEYYLQHADHYHRILLSLPPEELRPQFQPRTHYNNHSTEQAVGADGQQAEGAVAQGEQHNGHAPSHAEERHESPPAQQLPAFITQAQHPESPEER